MLGGAGESAVLHLPQKKRGGEVSFSHGEGGHKRFWGSFNIGACSFRHTGVGRKTFPLFKRWDAQSFTQSCGGGGKKFHTRVFPIL